MDLVNELENDLAQAFFVEKKHSEKIDSKEILILLNKVRAVLTPLASEKSKESVMIAGTSDSGLAH